MWHNETPMTPPGCLWFSNDHPEFMTLFRVNEPSFLFLASVNPGHCRKNYKTSFLRAANSHEKRTGICWWFNLYHMLNTTLYMHIYVIKRDLCDFLKLVNRSLVTPASSPWGKFDTGSHGSLGNCKPDRIILTNSVQWRCGWPRETERNMDVLHITGSRWITVWSLPSNRQTICHTCSIRQLMVISLSCTGLNRLGGKYSTWGHNL